jgi:predicted phosphoribosyltransferase
MAIPAGGVPVGAAVAKKLDMELDLAVVSKALLPWNTEAGFGAVAFDGLIKLNETMVKQSGLSDEQIEKQVSAAKQKVQRRMRDLRGKRNLPNLEGRTVFLVDDGIASGFTMLVGAEAIRAHQPGELIIAVPTAHGESLDRLEPVVDKIYCPNIRTGMSFAVASAYEKWYDLTETETAEIIKRFRKG